MAIEMNVISNGYINHQNHMNVEKCETLDDFKTTMDQIRGLRGRNIIEVSLRDGKQTFAFRQISLFELFIAKVFKWKPESIRQDTVKQVVAEFIQENHDYFIELSSDEQEGIFSSPLVDSHQISKIILGVFQARLSEKQAMILDSNEMSQHLRKKIEFFEPLAQRIKKIEEKEKALDEEIVLKRKKTDEYAKKTLKQTTNIQANALKTQSHRQGIRNNTVDADILLEGHDGSVKAHRVMLTAIDFFSNRTRDQMEQPEHSKLLRYDLPATTTKTINHFLDFQYGLGLPDKVSFDDLNNLYELALFLNHQELMKSVFSLVMDAMNSENRDIWLPELFNYIIYSPQDIEPKVLNNFIKQIGFSKLEVQRDFILRLSEFLIKTPHDKNALQLLNSCLDLVDKTTSKILLPLIALLAINSSEFLSKIPAFFVKFINHMILSEAETQKAFLHSLKSFVQENPHNPGAEAFLELAKKEGIGATKEFLFELATQYGEGNGVERDDNKALLFWTYAADQGYARAQNALGCVYYQGIPDILTINQHLAINYFKLAVEQGCAAAQYNLGKLYISGTGHALSQDLKEGFRLLNLAAEQNYINAFYDLGKCYLDGIGTTRNKKAALACFLKQADQDPRSKKAVDRLQGRPGWY